MKSINIDEETVSSKTFEKIKDWIQSASAVTSKKLIEVMFKKFKLKGHLIALKKFLLIGQGDFLQYLMDLISEELNNPADKIYKQSMASILDTAIRASNA